MTGPNGATPISVFHLTVRFILELAVYAGFAIWGWHVGSSLFASIGLAFAFVVIPMALWGIFGAEGDPSRGRALVTIPGWLRLALEVAIFGASAYGIWTSWSRAAAETLLTALALHYAVTWERTRWLILGDQTERKTSQEPTE